MRYRFTFFIGLAVGFVIGARAGRERYEQINKLFGAATATTRAPVGEKSAALRNLALEWVRDGIDERLQSFRARGGEAGGGRG